MMRTISVLALLGLCAWPALAQHQHRSDRSIGWVPRSLEYLAYQSELIVIGQAEVVGGPQWMSLRTSEGGEVGRAKMTRFRIRVSSVLKDPGKVIKGKPNGRAGEQEDLGQIDVLGSCSCLLSPNTSYVLILRKLQGRSAYLLRYRPQCRQKATPAVIKRVKAAVETDKWPWGKAVDGLQLVMLTDSKPLLVQLGPKVFVYARLVLRNISGKPISVNMYRGDSFLTLRAVGPAGAKLEPHLYAGQRGMRPFGGAHVRLIEPGQLLFFDKNGELYTQMFNLPLTAGAWSLQAGYESVRQAEGQTLWAGKLESRPAKVEVPRLTAKAIRKLKAANKRAAERRRLAEAEREIMEDKRREAQQEEERIYREKLRRKR